MTDYKLTTITKDNLNELKCVDFRKNVNKMLTAEMAMNKDLWSYAIAVNNIVVNKYYETDCKTIDGFAERMGVKKGTISKYTNSVSCMVNVLGKYGYTMLNMSYSTAYKLSTLKDDLDDFIKWCGKDLTKVTMRELEELVKEYKSVIKGAIDEPKQEEQEEPKQEEQEEKELPSFTGRIDEDSIFFSINNKNYVIPFDELKHYQVH